MLGAIAGDIIGSVYEGHAIKTTDFPLFIHGSRFTDDTVLTVAVADAILHGKPYKDTIRAYGRQYPNAGYGGSFIRWMYARNDGPYNSWGNGSAMRVSPVGFAFQSGERVLKEARDSAAVTHSHPEGVKGAQAVAYGIYLCRRGRSISSVRQSITDRFGYDLDRRLDDIRPSYRFDVSCQGSVPEAMIAFFESRDYEDAVRKAVSLGGDADTQACIAGALAEACYGGVPQWIADAVRERLPKAFLDILEKFYNTYK